MKNDHAAGLDERRGKWLLLIKILHTAVWLFFNVVIFYLLYAVVQNKIGVWVWVGLGLFAVEGITLLLFGMMCPLTIMARKYSDSGKDNFDIFLPNWLARNTKRVCTGLLLLIIIALVCRLITN